MLAKSWYQVCRRVCRKVRRRDDGEGLSSILSNLTIQHNAEVKYQGLVIILYTNLSS